MSIHYSITRRIYKIMVIILCCDTLLTLYVWYLSVYGISGSASPITFYTSIFVSLGRLPYLLPDFLCYRLEVSIKFWLCLHASFWEAESPMGSDIVTLVLLLILSCESLLCLQWCHIAQAGLKLHT